MLKAVNKAVPFLLEYDFSSGNKTEDAMTTKIIKEIFRYELHDMDLIEDAFQDTYEYFDNFTSSNRISELIIRFRNISSIIDCVTCSKCRMHAKLEVFGIATMLKIMFSSSTEDLKKSMSRNELVSFINLFAKLSKSVSNIQMIDLGIQKAHHNIRMKKFKCISFIGIVGVILTFILLNVANSEENKNKDKKNKDEIKKIKQETYKNHIINRKKKVE